MIASKNSNEDKQQRVGFLEVRRVPLWHLADTPATGVYCIVPGSTYMYNSHSFCYSTFSVCVSHDVLH